MNLDPSKALYKVRFRLIFLLVVAGASIVALMYVAFYPRTTITRGVMPGQLNNDGTPPATFLSAVEEMKPLGVTLKFKSQGEKGAAKPLLEFLIADPEVDWAIVPNTGAQLPDGVEGNFVSLGVVRYNPLGFYVKPGDRRIERIGDLRGKRIVISSSPEGKARPVFLKGGEKASIYSTDYVFEQIFAAVGVTDENSAIINVWPNSLLSAPEWDVIIARIPNVSAAQRQAGLLEGLTSGQIMLAELGDLEALVRKVPALKLVKIPASGIDLGKGVPTHDVTVPAFTFSAVTRRDLDPGMQIAIAEHLKNTYGHPGPVSNKGEFPNFASAEHFKPSKAAKDYYDHGLPVTRSFLSPGMHGFVVNTLLLLVPLLTIAWPVAHFLPSLYGSFAKHKITRYYDELNELEAQASRSDDKVREEMLARVNVIDSELKNLRFPFMHNHFVQDLYTAREHADLTRNRIAGNG